MEHWNGSGFDVTSGPARAFMRSPSRETEDAERGNDSDCEHNEAGGFFGTIRQHAEPNQAWALAVAEPAAVADNPSVAPAPDRAHGTKQALVLRSSHWNLRRTGGRRHCCGWSPAGPASGVRCFINDQLPAGPGELRRVGLAIEPCCPARRWRPIRPASSRLARTPPSPAPGLGPGPPSSAG